jgi:hypothetical protein
MNYEAIRAVLEYLLPFAVFVVFIGWIVMACNDTNE